MSESDRAVTVKDVAQFLEMSTSAAHGILKLMEVFKIVQSVKRGKTYYFLTGVYNDEQIEAMLPPKKIARIPRRRRYRSIPAPPKFDDNFMEEYLSAVRVESSSGEGISALAMIGLSRQETAEKVTPTKELPRDLDIEDLGIGIEVEERKFGAPIRNEPFATVKYLPKDLRLLNSGEARYLKDQLKALEGYEEIEGLGSVFARFSALEYGRYGNVLYFSLGTNQWDYVKKVTIDRSTSDFIVLPIIERKRWSSWNHFLMGLKETREKYGKEEYDKMIDQFMESGHDLVEVTVENRGVYYVRNVLSKRIIERGLEEQVKASHVDEWIYLEKVE
ncbi:MAG: hypothetical protein NWE89_08325 [Candidatus Bathyarchaeota archaeon]|nr:hypothetical protein [Candidatus Bathyarchaeota archaeon]